jgi:hypothetical protein
VTVYDKIGQSYRRTRRADPRIADAIFAALGDASSVVNVGAGAGSYEPPQTLLAVEPSGVMIEQRPVATAPVVQATAEALPLRDESVDAALPPTPREHWPGQCAAGEESGALHAESSSGHAPRRSRTGLASPSSK